MIEGWKRQMLFSLQRYFTFFVVMSFVVTCCMLTFLSLMTSSMQLELTNEQIHGAAILTFGNVVLLTLIFTIVDGLRRKFMVERPVKRIISAAEEIMRGNFSHRFYCQRLPRIENALVGHSELCGYPPTAESPGAAAGGICQDRYRRLPPPVQPDYQYLKAEQAGESANLPG